MHKVDLGRLNRVVLIAVDLQFDESAIEAGALWAHDRCLPVGEGAIFFIFQTKGDVGIATARRLLVLLVQLEESRHCQSVIDKAHKDWLNTQKFYHEDMP